MTYDEFKRQLGKAALNLREFAFLVKLNPSSVSNYKKTKKVPRHYAVIAVLMGEMAENKIDFRKILSDIDIEAHKVRGKAVKGKFGWDENNSK